MVANTSAQVTAGDLRTVMLAALISFAGGAVLFHFIIRAGYGDVFSSDLIATLFTATLIVAAMMAIFTVALARKLRLDNLRMRVAINNMSQGLCMFD